MIKRLINRECSISRTVEIIGDRWTFLILGEAFFGIKSYDQFRINLGIATNILSDRLKILVENNIMVRKKNPDDARRFIYELTEKGIDIYPISLSIMNWGDKWLTGDNEPPLTLTHKNCGEKLKPVMCCSNCKEEIHAREVIFGDRPPLKH